MGKQPGVMLYFEIRPSLRRLSDVEKGQLFEAILDYGEFGLVPELEGMVGMAWDFIRPRLDRDRERYDQLVQKRTDAANARWGRERQRGAPASGCKRMPTTTTTTNPNSFSIPDPFANPPQPPPDRGAEEDFNTKRQRAIAQLSTAGNTL